MSKNITDNNLATDARSALLFWEGHPDIKLQGITCEQFKQTQGEFQQVADEVVVKDGELQAAMTERDKLGDQVRLVITRLRSGVRSYYGPDSDEYKLVGGTRQSDRRRPVRRTNGAETVPVNGNGRANQN